jgi:hypothetical protein
LFLRIILHNTGLYQKGQYWCNKTLFTLGSLSEGTELEPTPTTLNKGRGRRERKKSGSERGKRVVERE